MLYDSEQSWHWLLPRLMFIYTCPCCHNNRTILQSAITDRSSTCLACEKSGEWAAHFFLKFQKTFATHAQVEHVEVHSLQSRHRCHLYLQSINKILTKYMLKIYWFRRNYTVVLTVHAPASLSSIVIYVAVIVHTLRRACYRWDQ